MSDSSHDTTDALGAALRAAKPAPRDEFTAALDRRVADRFQSEIGREGKTGPAPSATTWVRGVWARVSSRIGVGRKRPTFALGALATVSAFLIAAVVTIPQLSNESTVDSAAVQPGPAESRSAADAVSPEGLNEFSNRIVDRGASLVLSASPEDIGAINREILEIGEQHEVIVQRSSSQTSESAGARARFDLLVPAGDLESFIAEISSIAEVKERRDRTLDITASTVSVRDQLAAAQADVEGLLERLSRAEDDDERDEIRRELERAQSLVAMHRSELERLRTRASYANVDVTVLTHEEASGAPGSAWTIDQALHDALKVLTVTAGILLVASAALLPIAAILLLGAYLRRLLLDRRREQALN